MASICLPPMMCTSIDSRCVANLKPTPQAEATGSIQILFTGSLGTCFSWLSAQFPEAGSLPRLSLRGFQSHGAQKCKSLGHQRQVLVGCFLCRLHLSTSILQAVGRCRAGVCLHPLATQQESAVTLYPAGNNKVEGEGKNGRDSQQAPVPLTDTED